MPGTVVFSMTCLNIARSRTESWNEYGLEQLIPSTIGAFSLMEIGSLWLQPMLRLSQTLSATSMTTKLKFLIFVAAASFGLTASAAEFFISLPGTATVSRHIAKMQCDSHAAGLGLPSGTFNVEYLNGGGNSLAVLPLGGQNIIFAGVNSGSGSRYAAGSFTWWDAGLRGIHLYSDSLSGKDQASCQEVK